MSYYHHLIKSGASYGALTTAWISATGETDTTIIGALNTFETDTVSILSKLDGIFPFAGGSASKHSKNFKDTSVFDTTWYGGVTHDANGITGNAVNARGESTFIPSSNSLQNDSHLSIYVRSTINEVKVDAGCGDTGNNKGFEIWSNAGGSSYAGMNDTSVNITATVDSKGLICINRSASNVRKLYKNGSLVSTDAETSVGLNSQPLNFLCLNNGGTKSYYSSKNLAFITFGKSLDASEQTLLYNAIQAFQTTLGRNV
jgi:hypothetical protein